MDIEKLIREVSEEIGAVSSAGEGSDKKDAAALNEIALKLEHSMSAPDLCEKTVLEACKQARKYHIAAVCVPPYHTSAAKQALMGSGVAVCTLIGVPNALFSMDAKLADVRYSLLSGADELDVAINGMAVKSGRIGDALRELSAIVDAAKGRAIVKAAVELSLFTEGERQRVLYMVKESGAVYVKIQNVLSGKAADPIDIKYVKEVLRGNVRIKIDGGVKTPEKASSLLSAGADRIGLTATFDILEKIQRQVFIR